jgi:hypothetical protein
LIFVAATTVVRDCGFLVATALAVVVEEEEGVAAAGEEVTDTSAIAIGSSFAFANSEPPRMMALTVARVPNVMRLSIFRTSLVEPSLSASSIHSDFLGVMVTPFHKEKVELLP